MDEFTLTPGGSISGISGMLLGSSTVPAKREHSIDDDDSLSASGDFEAESSAGKQGLKEKKRRSGKACTACRSVKSKCLVLPGQSKCERCRSTDASCIYLKSNRGRRPKQTAAPADPQSVLPPPLLAPLLPPPVPPPPPPSSQQLHSVHNGYNLVQSGRPTDFMRSPSTAASASTSSSHPPVSPAFMDMGRGPLSLSTNRSQPSPLHSGDRPTPVTPNVELVSEKKADSTMNPLGLLAQASLEQAEYRHASANLAQASSRDTPLDGKQLGIAGAEYFASERNVLLAPVRQPVNSFGGSQLVKRGILSRGEVIDLFDVYFTSMYQHLGIVDPQIHKPETCLARSEFLFTAICLVASRYYKRRTGLYVLCQPVVASLAPNFLVPGGWKSLETIQAFAILAKYAQPHRKFEDEISYSLCGFAVRIGLDLGLNKRVKLPPLDDLREDQILDIEREVRNRERCWMIVWVCDRSVSTQLGKPNIIPREDPVVRSIRKWYDHPQAIVPYDYSLCAMVELHTIVGKMVDSFNEEAEKEVMGDASATYLILVKMFNNMLENWNAEWDTNAPELYRGVVKSSFYYQYYRLWLHAFAVQQSLHRPEAALDLQRYCLTCFDAAKQLIVLAEYYQAQGWLSYTLDANLVNLSYAAAHLLKITSPLVRASIPEREAFNLVERLCDALESAALDEQHSPFLYASFLRSLLRRRQETIRQSREPTPSRELDSYTFSRPRTPNGGENQQWTSLSSLELFGPEGALDQSLPISETFWNHMLMPGLNADMGGFAPPSDPSWPEFSMPFLNSAAPSPRLPSL